MLVSSHGFDRILAQKDISYGNKLDLREEFNAGDESEAVFYGFTEDGKIRLSLKDARPHPFIGADKRHPPHTRRTARITGKYAGGVFCALERDLTCYCFYSPEQRDSDYDPGDTVVIVIRNYDYTNKRVYGTIVGKR
jgi:ribosomal protein S1